MLRGYLTGGLSGLVVSAVGLGTASLIAEQPPGNQPPQRPVVESPDIADVAETTETEGVLPDVTADAGGAPAPSETPEVVVESGGTPQVQTDTSPLEQPDTGEVTAGLSAPQTTDDPVVGASTDTPVDEAAAGTAPAVPDNEADIVLETTTPPPPEVIVVEDVPEDGAEEVVVVVVEDEDATVAEAEEAAEGAEDPAAGTEMAEAVEEAVTEEPAAEEDAVEADAGAEMAEEVDAATGDDAAETVETEDGAEAEVAEEMAPTTGDEAVDPAGAEDVAQDAAEPTEDVAADDAETDVATDTAMAEDTADTADGETAPEASLAEAETGEDSTTGAGDADIAALDSDTAEADPSAAPVMVAPEVDGSLPVTPSTDEEDSGSSLIALQGDAVSLPGQQAVRIVGGDDAAEEPEAAAEVAEEVAPDAPASALAAYAAEFDLPEGRPSMSVILVDDGSLAGGAAALADLPFDVTVALDPAAEGAAAMMEAYRAAGIEVLAMAGVPAGAQPTDVEVALEAGFLALPEAIGLLDIGQAGLQTDRVLAAQAMARLSGDGRGFVTLSQGLNSGLRAADDADVPATTIYRDLDSNDQDARVIRRFLDQAAFRARQQGSVVLVARVRADTISALTLWHTANAGGEVVMAPVSAVLLAGQE